MARPRGYSDIPQGYRGVWLSSARRLAGPGKRARFGKKTNDASQASAHMQKTAGM